MKMKWTRSLCVILSVLALTCAWPRPAFSAGETADPNLVGWWKLDDGTGLTAVDSSGHGNNGTLNGTAVWGIGRIHGGLTFDGTSTYVECTGGTGLDVRSALTLTMWVRTADAANGERNAYLMKGEFTYGMRHTDANSIEFYIYSGGFQRLRVPVAGAFNGTWHHLAGTYDGSALQLYIDGQVKATTSCTGLINQDTAYLLNLGRNNQGDSANRWWYQGDLDEVRVYDRALSQEEIQKLLQPELVSMPIPGDGARYEWPDAALRWTAGVTAVAHDVYLGTVLADVSQATRTSPRGVLVSQGQDKAVYQPAALFALDQTYYWRVDEVGAPPDVGPFKGEVWRFTVPFAFPVSGITATASSSNKPNTGPETTIQGVGLDAEDLHGTDISTMWLSSKEATPPWIQYEFDKAYKLHQMWVWNYNAQTELSLGFGINDATIEYSTNGVDWLTLGDFQFAQGAAKAGYAHNTTVDFNDVVARYVRITAQSNFRGRTQYGLSEVRFLCIPVHATEPEPASGQTLEGPDVVLSWRPGRGAVSHEVFLSSDANAVQTGSALKAKTATNSYDTAGLDLQYATTYHWRINEVDASQVWEGNIWSFSIPATSVLDDFESYNDDCNRIYFGWVDGAGHGGSAECGVPGAAGNGSGAAVGYMIAPYAEPTTVHAGQQSMPLVYDNSMGPYYSEAIREWGTPQAWTRGGLDTLTVYLRGNPTAFEETSPGTILMNGTGTDIYGTADQGRFAYKPLTGDGAIIARVDSLANTDPWAKAGVMIRETLEPGSSWALVLLSSTMGSHFQARLTTGASATSDTSVTLPAEQTDLRVPAWIKLERKGNDFRGYYSLDGTTWISMVWNPQTISMTSTVYIGLAVTSHVANVVCGASFSNVSTTGSVAGQWQTADIGVAQITGNAPETVYVLVQDTVGRTAVISHPDQAVITTGAWEQWDIPLSQLSSAGINLGAVLRMGIGIGDRNAPKAGDAGTVLIDDILLSRTASP